MSREKFIRYSPVPINASESLYKSDLYYKFSNNRRTIRDFSDKPVAREVIENIIKSASTAPSGAHKQPWTFCAVSDPEIKTEIRKAAEQEKKKIMKHA
jgi:iodotyrosine deiodinase